MRTMLFVALAVLSLGTAQAQCSDAQKKEQAPAACQDKTAGCEGAKTIPAVKIADNASACAGGTKAASACGDKAGSDCASACADGTKAASACASGEGQSAKVAADCSGGGCEGKSLTEMVGFLQKGVTQGCDKAGGVLAALRETCGAKDDAVLAQRVAELEAAATKGCGTSAEMVADLQGIIASKRLALSSNQPLSARIATLRDGAAKGCKTSQSTLVALQQASETQCPNSLLKLVNGLEQAKGCEKSAGQLAKLQALIAPRKAKPAATGTFAARVAQIADYAAQGCPSSAKKLASLQAACETECSKSMMQQVSQLEASAAKGCEKSAAKLATLRAAFEGEPVQEQTPAKNWF